MFGSALSPRSASTSAGSKPAAKRLPWLITGILIAPRASTCAWASGSLLMSTGDELDAAGHEVVLGPHATAQPGRP